MTKMRFGPTRMLSYAGLFTWACVGIPLLWEPWYFEEASALDAFDMLAWRVSYFTFGLSYLFVSRRVGVRAVRSADLLALVLLTASAIGVSWFSESGLGGILLMVVSGVLPWLLHLRLGITWMVLQHIALAPVFALRPDFSVLDGVLQAVLYVGYSSFVYVSSLVARQQAEARDEQRRLNSELRATRALLAESSRLTERMRISRELHDLLGHHLTALSLNLEVASHLSQGKAQEHVRQAQSLAKLLLTDVREAVSQLREDDAIELGEALRALTEGVPGLAIELQIPTNLAVADPLRAQVILRCAQEIITNTVRHAHARRLQLAITLDDDGVHIAAEDDGQGSDTLTAGHGLRGMRERLEQYGGRLATQSRRGEGFKVDAWLPLGGLASTGRA